MVTLLLACAAPEPGLDLTSLAIRTSLDLRGVRPTREELDLVEAAPESLAGLTDTWLGDDRFEARVRDLYNEIYLTRVDSFPVSPADFGITDTPGYVRAIGEEPLRILSHVAASDLPWTTVVTAEWTFADQTLGAIWPVDYPVGGEGWRQVSYTDGRPAGGLLVANGLWWRYSSTASNGNRKRANVLSKALLCNDYLVRAIEFDRSINLLDEGAVADALRTQPGCVNCHVSLDPVASYLFGFQWWNWKDGHEARLYYPDREPMWKDVIGLPPSWYGQPGWSLGDLGPQIAADDRFVSCAVEQAFTLLVRRPPTLDDESALVAHREVFLSGGLTLRSLWRSVVGDSAYRTTEPKLATPDLLRTQIEDLTGFAWTWEGWDLMRSDVLGYRTLAGGADGYNVLTTSRAPNATMVLVQERLAEAAAWHAVYVEPERLFGTDDPAVDPRDDIEASVALLQHLHRRLFGEVLPTDDPAIAEEIALWGELYDAEGDTREAWAGVVSALLRDPRLVVY